MKFATSIWQVDGLWKKRW